MITTVEAKLPRLVTALPGPNAKRVVEADTKFMLPSYTRDYPLVAKRGYGAVVDHRTLPSGHELSQADVTLATQWLKAHAA